MGIYIFRVHHHTVGSILILTMGVLWVENLWTMIRKKCDDAEQRLRGSSRRWTTRSSALSRVNGGCKQTRKRYQSTEFSSISLSSRQQVSLEHSRSIWIFSKWQIIENMDWFCPSISRKKNVLTKTLIFLYDENHIKFFSTQI